METINHEYYVSPELVKLLKEAGFNWKEYLKPLSIYDGGGSIWKIPLHIAQKWLREVKKISVEVKTRRWVNRYQDGKYTVSYTYELWPIDTSIVPNDDDKFSHYTIYYACNIEFQTYEEAKEAGEKKTLELILEKGE